jgi:hypothetical protein
LRKKGGLDLKAVAETGFSLTPPGRVYEIGKGAVDLVDDFKSGNFEKTANNVIGRVVPKGLRKIGVPKKSIGGGSDISDLIGSGISLGIDSNDISPPRRSQTKPSLCNCLQILFRFNLRLTPIGF